MQIKTKLCAIALLVFTYQQSSAQSNVQLALSCPDTISALGLSYAHVFFINHSAAASGIGAANGDFFSSELSTINLDWKVFEGRGFRMMCGYFFIPINPHDTLKEKIQVNLFQLLREYPSEIEPLLLQGGKAKLRITSKFGDPKIVSNIKDIVILPLPAADRFVYESLKLTSRSIFEIPNPSNEMGSYSKEVCRNIINEFPTSTFAILSQMKIVDIESHNLFLKPEKRAALKAEMEPLKNSPHEVIRKLSAFIIKCLEPLKFDDDDE